MAQRDLFDGSGLDRSRSAGGPQGHQQQRYLRQVGPAAFVPVRAEGPGGNLVERGDERGSVGRLSLDEDVRTAVPRIVVDRR